MYTELVRFRERTGKPVVAVALDVMASGAYYLACAADRIVVHPTSVVGSIGVILILPEFSGTMQKLGIRANVIKSGRDEGRWLAVPRDGAVGATGLPGDDRRHVRPAL